MIPLARVVIDQATQDLVLAVLQSGHLVQGPMVERFERYCAEMAGTAHAVAVNSGTAALQLALHAYGIGPGDEVITSPFTFAATINAILHSGAQVRFADVGDDYTIDPNAIEAVITGRTKAILPVHLFGLPADMTAIQSIATAHDLRIIEDAAQAHGASVDGVPVGGFGLGCFSFYATKNIHTGEGGVVTTNDERLARSMRIVRNQGMGATRASELVGHNYRMMDLVAAIGVGQFDRRVEVDGARRSNAEKLTKGLAGIAGLVLPFEPAGRRSVWHHYTVRVGEGGVPRSEFVRRVNEQGVGCGVYYERAAYDFDCYRHHPLVHTDECPTAEAFAQSVVSLPVHQHLTTDELDTIIDVASKVLRC